MSLLKAVYKPCRKILKFGWVIAILLIAATIILGYFGFRATPNNLGKPNAEVESLYRAVALLGIQTGASDVKAVAVLEIARWTGMLFWASAIAAVAFRVFREAAHAMLVKRLARNHTIVAGLGENGGRLVIALQKAGRDVVVVEPDRSHPAVEQCRASGAIVVFGEPDDADTLRAVNLEWAAELLALFPPERDCVRIATAAYDILHPERPTSTQPPVRCVLRVIEPGLLDVVRQHVMHSDGTDRFQLEVLNSHEIAATTMVREATANSLRGDLGRVLVVGLGRHHRLGELVVLRAAKDHVVACNGEVTTKLEIHVYDRESREWLKSFQSRYPKLASEVCDIRTQRGWARKIGPLRFTETYDAAFVCIADEGHATAQAFMLRKEVLRNNEPIMVRVVHTETGFGRLIEYGDDKRSKGSGNGWGDNIHAVGLEDALIDPHMATRPEIELMAQTNHQEFRRLKRKQYLAATDDAAKAKILGRRANCPWRVLDEWYRLQNRRFVEAYDRYLNGVFDKKTSCYRRKFVPDPFDAISLRTVVADHEIATIAEWEHGRWYREMLEGGWKRGPDEHDNEHPMLIPWEQLTDEDRAYAREYMRVMPRVLELADYAIVPAV